MELCVGGKERGGSCGEELGGSWCVEFGVSWSEGRRGVWRKAGRGRREEQTEKLGVELRVLFLIVGVTKIFYSHVCIVVSVFNFTSLQ